MAKAKRAVTDLMRLQVAARDGVICQYCGDVTAAKYNIDHVLPFHLGGPCAVYNLVMACVACNKRKEGKVWTPRNLDQIMADQPELRARVLHLAAHPDEAGPPALVATVPVAVALVPVRAQVIDFYGDAIPVLQMADGSLYVALRPIATFLGLHWSSQVKRLNRDAVLTEAIRSVLVMIPNLGERAMTCLPVDLLPGWLFGIQAARVRPELQEKILRYRRECYWLLSQAFQAHSLPTLPR